MKIIPIPLNKGITRLDAVPSSNFVEINSSAPGWIILVKKEGIKFKEIE